MATYKEMRGDIPVEIFVPYQAANTTGGVSWYVPWNLTITSAVLIPSAAITANGTNYLTLSFFNRGAAGAGTAQWATARSYASVNSVKATPETLTLSSTAADLSLTAGDVVQIENAPTGSGLIWPGGSVYVVARRR
jgi:hypothetical protein